MQHTVYLFDGFQLDVTRRKLVSSGGLVQPLNSRAMDALLLLLGNAGELVEKRRLMQAVWPNAIVEENNLNQCVLAIRKALGETAGSNRYIMTVPGRGYRFVSPVRVMQQESHWDATPSHAPAWRSSPVKWLGIAAGMSFIVVAVMMPNATPRTSDPLWAIFELTTPSSLSSPEVVLRLHDPPPGTNRDGRESTALLARCLGLLPDMPLRLKIELLDENGGLVWNGEYSTKALAATALPAGTPTALAQCNELANAMREALTGSAQ